MFFFVYIRFCFEQTFALAVSHTASAQFVQSGRFFHPIHLSVRGKNCPERKKAECDKRYFYIVMKY